MINFPHLATKMFNVPLVLDPAKAEIVMSALGERLGITHLIRAGGKPLVIGSLDDFDLEDDQAADEKPYVVIDGVAIIPICGTIVQKLGSMRPYSGMTGCDGIRGNLAMALSDPAVRGIMLDIDSPGGEVPGLFDLADAVYFARAEKPIWAVLDESALSGAYLLASACSRITIPRTGGLGSIGAICLLVDLSRALSSAGITVNIIQYGDRKSDGNQAQPLSDEARARVQDRIDTVGRLFADTVARNRGLPVQRVIDTQAGIFGAADGLSLGLADAIMAPDEAFRALRDTVAA